jgi:hypothetical protein
MKKPNLKDDSPASPGNRAWDVARGVTPPKSPKVITSDFVADLRGGPEIKAPNGLTVGAPKSKP